MCKVTRHDDLELSGLWVEPLRKWKCARGQTSECQKSAHGRLEAVCRSKDGKSSEKDSHEGCCNWFYVFHNGVQYV